MRKLEGNIRKDLKEIGINTRNWVDSALGRDYWRALVSAALNLRVPQVMEFVSMLERNILFSTIFAISCQSRHDTGKLNLGHKSPQETAFHALRSYKVE